ncbi:NUDIX hydrolase [Nanchangia anserum]|uniref:NUDIX hydrolase n=1 Tax=Nanchangia anserum TaxID=2692125 RepID=A0A8I0KMW4_9ACTO|nr:NUDIX hydrolase [Nanchangia anserum]MBD3688641.1 NUDIX hydrolase [Nanchangia anserum]QOX82403.1 NUDIX hydrolase [Nanchangia anserum]
MIRDTVQDAEVKKSATIYRGAVFSFRSDEISLDDTAEPLTRDYIHHPGAVAIVALAEGENGPEICLVNQYRHPVGMRLWEVPAGLTDVPDESLVKAAQRELAEEAGLGARRWDTLADFYTSPGCTSEALRIFLARDLYETAAEGFVREGEEADMECRFVPLAEVIEAILSGHVHNPSLLVGVLTTAHAITSGFVGLRPADAPWQADRAMPGDAV